MPSEHEATTKVEAKRLLKLAKVGDRVVTLASSARGAGLYGTIVGLAEPLDSTPRLRVKYDGVGGRTVAVLPTSIRIVR